MTLPLVAIGASAGGLEALSELLSALPPKSEAAYVVIQHLDPTHKSFLTELLAKKTAMPVLPISDGMSVEPAKVYVIPPNVSVTLSGDHLRLTPRNREAERHHPVDRFFISLADERADAAIGVVLSGGDADGALGVQAIKHAGGITFAQAPQSARFPSMPQHAIATECVDFVLTPRQIAAELVQLERHPYLKIQREPQDPNPNEPRQPEQPAAQDEATLRRVFRRLRATHGVDFTHYKRSTLRRRMARRMALRKVDELPDYVAMLEDDPAETAALYQDFLIRVTGFFRDPESFDRLREEVFPTLTGTHPRKDPIRIWVPGCASGEEVYSLAIALTEYLGDRTSPLAIQIFGTDVSEVAIERARAARYLDTIAEEVSSERLKRFFVKEDSYYRIHKRIRDLCIFARQDVTRDPPFSRLDLVSCRNTLIYLDAAAQRRVMQVFHYALRPKGFLLLGPSESVGAATDLFELLDKHHRIYTRKAGPAHAGLELGEAGATTLHTREPAQQVEVQIPDLDSPQREADRLLLARFAPASVLVDEALNILQVRGETGPYLEFASGPPSLNLQRVARSPLLVEITPAIQEARESGAEVHREGIRIEPERDITVVVVPLKRSAPERCFLILFDDGSRPPSKRTSEAARSAMPESEKDRRIAQLERELGSTRDYLQATMEEHESSKEELKSAHEEVLSANEEFQSTNEELETAKEELQSANEELTTTNDELRNRNRELTTLNDAVQQARENAERARAYADAIINTVIAPLMVLDDTLKVLRANQSFYTDFELSREKSEGRALVELDEGQWNQPPLLGALHAVLTQNSALTGFELPYTVGRRGSRVLRVNGHKVPGDAGRSELILLAIEDVTERRANVQRLQLADQRKDEFLAMLAHELRNPLTPITHAVHILRHRDPRLDPAPIYALIDRQAHRLVRLVDDLLDVARITRGHIKLQREPLNLTPLVRNIVESCRVHLEERRHTLTVDLPEAPMEVDGDPLRLEQIVSNLLENAIKYTEPGGRIAVSMRAEGDEIALSVRDTGIGLSPEDRETIFDLFTQVDTSLARSGGGLGIGLTVARRLVTLHSGRIEVHSAGKGRGSEFIVRLPRLTDAAHPTKSRIKLTPARETESPASRRRVLIVEDNKDAAESLLQLVGSWGHEVVAARDGPTALALIEHFEPDIAVLDIGLPGMDGYELARHLREAARGRPLQLLAMTGYGRTEDREAALSAGFDEHLVKPADVGILQDLLANGRRSVGAD